MFDHAEQRFVFVATFGADAEVVADERGEFVSVPAFGFLLHEFVQDGVYLAAGYIFLVKILKHGEEFERRLVGYFGLGGDTAADAIDQVSDVHSDVGTINRKLILLFLLECQQYVLRGQVFEREAFLEPQSGVVQ